MIGIIALASVGAGALFFMLALLKALVLESRLTRAHEKEPKQRSTTSLALVMMERYRKDRAA